MPILDHLTVNVSNYARSKAFYDRVLATIGAKPLMEFGTICGYGDTKPDFWIGSPKADASSSERASTFTPIHVAFVAKSKEQVDAFYKAAIEAGAKDNGPPGIRAHYHPNYYGAFVLDPDGHNIEAVIHTAG